MKRSELGSFLAAIQQVQPKYQPDPDQLTISDLQQSTEFCEAVRTLRDFGYTVGESVSIVRKNGVSARADQVKAAVLAVLAEDAGKVARKRGRPRKDAGIQRVARVQVSKSVPAAPISAVSEAKNVGVPETPKVATLEPKDVTVSEPVIGPVVEAKKSAVAESLSVPVQVPNSGAVSQAKSSTDRESVEPVPLVPPPDAGGTTRLSPPAFESIKPPNHRSSSALREDMV
jgi:hypothetical protein